MILVLWDIDRTLLYVGGVDRLVYQKVFEEVVGRRAQVLPARGTGVTMPLAVRQLLTDNGVADAVVDEHTRRIVQLLPERLADHADELRSEGVLMPGAVEALSAVSETAGLVPTVVTGNLRGSAETKLRTFGLHNYVDMEVGGYSSDDQYRPALVGVAQARARGKYGHEFTRDNTVIIGDSLEDVRTGRQGGARIIAVASGTTTADQLSLAGADKVLTDLNDAEAILAAIHALDAR
ncbi:haloacid dehalogenase-like hydrolase [Streptomyces sp. NBC_00846]|uniref:HAD family hydrolase n=1 Tax=Streptomyces sp. NBC_00846 TaxID=2975849 RepID=UPI003868C872|nr:haloacid dehalogenase-like hydrolase [Streptomyces sp. NBC_00846]